MHARRHGSSRAQVTLTVLTLSLPLPFLSLFLPCPTFSKESPIQTSSFTPEQHSNRFGACSFLRRLARSPVKYGHIFSSHSLAPAVFIVLRSTVLPSPPSPPRRRTSRSCARPTRTHFQRMATTAPLPPVPPHAKPSPKRGDGTQRRLFKSISRFLSGGKARPKLIGARAPPASGRAPSLGTLDSNAVPLRDVRGRSQRAPSASTSASELENGRLGDDDDEDDDGESRLSGISGADTDASVRPISPTSLAPSSIVSHTHTNSTSNASYAPTHRTFKSYASTKPTTLLSIDSGGANRIAVVPGAVVGHHGLTPSPSGGSLSPPGSANANAHTFSALPSSTTSMLPPPSPSSPVEVSQVPRHTLAHPRNNPHPASPPPDNASMLTLASSSFAPSIFLSRNSVPGGGGGHSLSGLRTSTRIEADEDASVRALAPSRRASDESIGSRSTWSAAVLGRGPASLRTVGTGGTGGDNLGGPGSGGTDSLEGIGETEGGGKVGETEAQKVVRKEGEEGGKSLEKDEEAGAELEHQVTPTAEVEEPVEAPTVVLPQPHTPTVSSPLSSPTTDTHTPVDTPPFDATAEHTKVLATPLIGGLSAGTFSTVPGHESESETEGEGGWTTPREEKAAGLTEKNDVARSFVSASGYETDAQSFVDAQSEAGQTDVEED